jgi:hypothetical protein
MISPFLEITLQENPLGKLNISLSAGNNGPNPKTSEEKTDEDACTAKLLRPIKPRLTMVLFFRKLLLVFSTIDYLQIKIRDIMNPAITVLQVVL